MRRAFIDITRSLFSWQMLYSSNAANLNVPCSHKPPCLCLSHSHNVEGLLQPLFSPFLTLTFLIQISIFAYFSCLNPTPISSKMPIPAKEEMFTSSIVAPRKHTQTCFLILCDGLKYYSPYIPSTPLPL